MTRLGKLLALTSVSLLVFAGSAHAAVFVIGSPLTKSFKSTVVFAESNTYTNRTLASGNPTSPVSGVIVRWNILDATGGPFQLNVLRPGSSGLATSLALSGAVTSTSTDLQSFPTNLPIQAGNSIGLTVFGKTSRVGQATGTAADIWEPALALGESRKAELSGNQEIAFNAEVQIAPTVASVSPTSGFTTGGSQVTIIGTDFEGAGSVRFGSVPATFTVDSESEITATVPAGTGSVPISVTTVAGTAIAPLQFTYTSPPPVTSPPPAPAPTCTVPRLRGKTLKSAKRQIRAADCRVGMLTKRAGATARNGQVVKQAPRPGATVAADTKVELTLAP
jgi:hypothetical protein